MIGVVDYNLGNVQAFLNIFKNLNIDAMAARNSDELVRADRLILPGVGSFDWAMEKLIASGMRDCLDEMVLKKGTCVLGVCVGMQMMARSSEEGKLPGLGWIKGEVKKFRGLEDERMSEGDREKLRGEEVERMEEKKFRGSENERISLPHMGWNDVVPRKGECLFKGMDAPRFYFLHSYYFETTQDDDVLATTDYHKVFASAVGAGNVFGAQFHPEKSHGWGVQLLKNFAEL
jgi:glutamine amidotransferase